MGQFATQKLCNYKKLKDLTWQQARTGIYLITSAYLLACSATVDRGSPFGQGGPRVRVPWSTRSSTRPPLVCARAECARASALRQRRRRCEGCAGSRGSSGNRCHYEQGHKSHSRDRDWRRGGLHTGERGAGPLRRQGNVERLPRI